MAIVRTRTLALFVVAALVLVTALAIALLNSRADARGELEENFGARASIAAAVIESTLRAAALTQGQQDARALRGARVTRADLERAALVIPGQTKIVADARGRVLGALPRSLAATGSNIAGRGPHVRRALAGETAAATIVRDGRVTLEIAAPITTRHGRRIAITGLPRPLVASFLGGYLRRIRAAGANEAYILGPSGALVAASGAGDAPALGAGARGHFQRNGETYVYAAAPVAGSDLRVVLLKPESELYEPIGGGRAWVVWVLFVGFTLMVAIALAQMVRLAGRARQLSAANATLEVRNAEVERAGQAKTDFLASMSHELRTPLNGIIGFAELMHDGRVGEVTERHREYLGDILTSAQHLRRLIDDALDLSKVEAGMLDIRPEPVDVGQLVSEVSEALRSLAVGKELELAVEIEPGLDGVVTDPGHLKQVLYNFLSNALKYTDRGGRIVARAHADAPGMFRVAVTDDGPGIAPENLARLWTAFQQLDGGTSRRYEGTGLGLALVKRIVEAQGGEVGVDTAPGAGSTFYAILPRTARRATSPLPALSDAR